MNRGCGSVGMAGSGGVGGRGGVGGFRLGEFLTEGRKERKPRSEWFSAAVGTLLPFRPSVLNVLGHAGPAVLAYYI